MGRDALTQHGHRGGGNHKRTGIYNSWRGAKDRCYGLGHRSYPAYGALGVRMYAPWAMSFAVFLNDMGASWFPGACLDRIDAGGDYEPGNVQWITRAANQRKQFLDRRKKGRRW